MKQLAFLFLAFAPLSLSSVPSQAQPSGARFACDAPAGRVSEFKIPIQASRFLLRGTIKPNAFRASDRWLPTATITLVNREDGRSLAINMIAENGEAQGAGVVVTSVNEGTTTESGVGMLAIGNVLDFSILYQADGESEIVVGEQRYTAQNYLGDGFEMALNCSTSDVVFEQIVWQALT